MRVPVAAVEFEPFGAGVDAGHNDGKDTTMNRFTLLNARCIATLALISTLVPLALAAQETAKVEGLIIGRSGDLVVLQTRQKPDLVVELTDDTDVGQVQGVLKARNKKMSMAA